MAERLVVIGGDAAGMTAASQARKMRGPQDLQIVAFEKGGYTSYSACGIPYFIGDTVDELQDLQVRTPEEFAKQNIEARIHSEVVAIDIDSRTVEVRDHQADRTYKEPFDQLVIATGATPIRPPIEGADAKGIFGVQTLGDGEAIDRYIKDNEPKRAVIVGAGYIGIEMAEALVVRGLSTSVVERDANPMGTLDEDMSEMVAAAMRSEGVVLHTGEAVERFEVENGRVSGVTTGERTIGTDMVVLGLGAEPNSKLAEEAGIGIGPSGGIRVDRMMRTDTEGVWAAGDCAEKFHLVSRRSVAIALGTHANKEGRTVGINIGGGYETFPGVLGTAVTKVCSLEVARTGLSEKEAVQAGFEFVTGKVDSTTRADYFPGSSPITTKLIAEKRSGRLLGGQIVGLEGAAKRIDVIATALWNSMTVDDMLQMDLSYAPPFSPLWDPVLIAARKTWSAVEKTH